MLQFFTRLLPRRDLWKLPSLKSSRFYDRLFTPLVTLWHLIFQRLQSDHTLEKVVADAHNGGADSIGRRLSKRISSAATVSYSNARQRLPLAFLAESLALQARSILALNPKAVWRGLTVCLLDGTIMRLRPYGDIPKHFPPHGNQAKTPPYWRLLRAVACFCAHTGAALGCALGDLSVSEQVLACQLLLRQSFGSCLYLGDRNFGVFRVAQTARAAKAHVLLRLTASRARKLLGCSLRPGDHKVSWKPTRHDQTQPGCSLDPAPGRLLVVRVKRPGFPALTLYLFTSLPGASEHPLEELVNL